MRFQIFIVIAMFAAQASASASVVDRAIRKLAGPGEITRTSPGGQRGELFFPEDDPDIQGLIDHVTQNILKSDLGMAIGHQVFGCQAKAFSYHLAMSPPAAKKAAHTCATTPLELNPLVFGAADISQSKILLTTHPVPRVYTILVTDQKEVAFDSWTEPYSNRTLLILRHIKGSDDLTEAHLAQIIAHEMAIYLDAKAWPDSSTWNTIPEFQSLRWLSFDRDKAVTASLNPAIATILSFVRAFKIERNIIEDLAKRNLLGTDPSVDYSEKEYPFFAEGCGHDCLSAYILSLKNWYNPLLSRLLALAPHYRVRRLAEVQNEMASYSPAVGDELLDVLARYPLLALKEMPLDIPSLLFLPDASGPSERLAQDATVGIFNQILLKEDLKALSNTSVIAKGWDFPRSLLAYLSIPLLSNANTAIASGPRPRIRTGGTR